MHGIGVGRGVHRDRGDADLPAGAQNPERNLSRLAINTFSNIGAI